MLGWGARGIPSHAFRAPQHNPNLLSLLSLQIHINSNGVRVWDWGVRKQWSVEENYWLTRMLPLPRQPFFFLLSHELRDEQYKKKWLRNDLASKCNQFVIRPLNSGLWALKKEEERRRLRPFFDTSKRLSYFYLSTMNILLISGNFLDVAFRHWRSDKDGSLSGKNVKFPCLFGERYGTDKTQIRLVRFHVGEFGLLSLF